MPQASSRLPKLITLLWGSDRLEVDDPVWISKIVQEMAEQSQPDEEVECLGFLTWWMQCCIHHAQSDSGACKVNLLE